MTGKPDEELLAEHIAGAPDAFNALVRRYANELFNFFSRFVGNRSAADDLVQETLLQVHLAASSFDTTRRFKPWLYTIAANKGRDYMRARGRKPTHSLDASSPDRDSPSPATLLEAEQDSSLSKVVQQEQRKRVQAVVAKMPDHLRLILTLGYFQRLPYAEIADILDIPVGTVKSRLHSAIGNFGRLWQDAEMGKSD